MDFASPPATTVGRLRAPRPIVPFRSRVAPPNEPIRDWQIGHLARDTAGYWPDRKNWGPIVVPHDSMFVMGDNRDHSWDGRYWGFLPRANVRGTPLFIYYSYDPDTYKPLPALTNIRWGRLFHVPR